MSKNSKQIKINYENMMKIEERYNDLVMDVVCYIRAELTSNDAEEAINDINEILLGAQERGENLFEIIGDHKEFCKEVIESYKSGVKNYKLKILMDYFPIIMYGILLFFALDIINSVIFRKPNTINELINMNYTMTLAPIINSVIGIIISIVVFKFVAKTENRNIKNKKMGILFFVLWILMTAGFVGTGLIASNIEIIVLNNISILIAGAAIVIIFSIVHMIKFSGPRKIKK